MAAVDSFRSPRDKSVGGLHHLARMIDKIRLKGAGALPEGYHRNYGLSVGLDGQLCSFLNVKFEAVEARVLVGGTDAEIAEWIFAQGFRPNRTQTLVWNEHSRKLGWNDRLTSFIAKVKADSALAHRTDLLTTFDLIDANEGRDSGT
ncbi:DUF5069 domain-containing protein [Oleiharenicola lentus]|uniref:DUF5069 domain-containing protein n=1 Tax=Oleiharenicola lentus TaxID=2508720 RepID=UPI003F668B5D